MSQPVIHIEGVGSLVWEHQHSLLEALEDAGVDINYSCRTGVCAACRIKLISGEVHWRNQPIIGLAAGEILACSTTPLTDLTLALVDN